MNFRKYKIFSIVFIVIGLALIVSVLFFFKGMPVGQKILLLVCVAVLVGAMAYNVKVISAKQKEAEKKDREQK